jgi:hypothetical protein
VTVIEGNSYFSNVVAFSLLTFPFVNILHFLVPMPLVFGKSFWLTAVFGILFACLLLSKGDVPREKWFDEGWGLHFAAAMLFVACCARAFLYQESVPLTSIRFAGTGVVYVGLAGAIARDGKANLLIIKSIILQGVLISFSVFLNMNFFPGLRLYADEYGLAGLTSNGILTRSMLFDASIGSNHIICAMFALCAYVKVKNTLSSGGWVLFWFFLVFMVFCISMMGSRYPIVISIFLFLIAVHGFRGRQSYKALSGAFVLLVVLNVGVDLSLPYFKEAFMDRGLSGDVVLPNLRFSENDGGRLEKIKLAIGMLFNTWQNFVLGPPTWEFSNALSPKGLRFSDNSYFMLMLVAGVPSALAFIFLWAWHLKAYACSGLTFFCLLYFSGSLMLTNGIFWESWVCTVLFTLISMNALLKTCSSKFVDVKSFKTPQKTFSIRSVA